MIVGFADRKGNPEVGVVRKPLVGGLEALVYRGLGLGVKSATLKELGLVARLRA